MAISGTVSQSIPKLNEIYEHAFRRAGVPAEMITAGHIQIAKSLLNLFLSQLAIGGVRLWTHDVVLLGMREGLHKVTMPVGTTEVDDVVIRTMNITEGTLGGSSPSWTLTLASGDEIDAEYLGFKCGAGTYDIAIDESSDGVSWSEIATFEYVQTFANQWNWLELIPASSGHRYYRLRETNAATIAVTDICVATESSEKPLGQYSQDDYAYVPNKRTKGSVHSYFVDMQVDGPILYLHAAPDADHASRQLVVWRKRHIKDVGAMTSRIEIPHRWHEVVIWGLAHQIAAEITEATKTPEEIKPKLGEALLIASHSETDGGIMKFDFDVGAYTR